MTVLKRDGVEVDFDKEKIFNAIMKANKSVDISDRMREDTAHEIANHIENISTVQKRSLSVEEIQDEVEKSIIMFSSKKDSGYSHPLVNLFKAYTIYRYEHALARAKNTTEDQLLSIINCNNEEANQENANKNPTLIPTQRDYMAGIDSKDLLRRRVIPSNYMKHHDEGIYHIHDTDYRIQKIYNCCLINLEDMLQNGTVISGKRIDKPHLFSTACNITTQIIAQVASSQYGGQTINVYHLAPFVDISRKKFMKEARTSFEKICSVFPLLKFLYDHVKVIHNKIDNIITDIVEKNTRTDITRGIQTIQYQIVTLMTTNGQAPFCSLFMYLNEATDENLRRDYAYIIEEILKQRIQGIKNVDGDWVPAEFPKLLYVLQDNNIEPDSPYYYLTKLAAECTASRMVPDYMSEKKLKELKDGQVYGCMGCRSLLSLWKDPETKKYKFWGRFNKGVISINLPYVALLAKEQCGDNKEVIIDTFYKLLDEYLEEIHQLHEIFNERLMGTYSDIAPILWQNGAIARLKPGEKIDKYLLGGYSTCSLGYVGLSETLIALTGKDHTHNATLGLEILDHLNDKCAEWNKLKNWGYSIYGTPEESTTYKFSKALKNRFGEIPGITDKMYVTNSYHIDPKIKIDAFEKLTFESKFQEKSLGGAISYVEVPNMKNNIPAVLSLIKHIYNTMIYAELNSRFDFCRKCGAENQITLVRDENNKWIWKCKSCGNTDFNYMNVYRRTCGYIGSNETNQGRKDEFASRAFHVDCAE